MEVASKKERRGIDDLDDGDKRAISKGEKRKKRKKITNLKRIDQNNNRKSSNNKKRKAFKRNEIRKKRWKAALSKNK